MVGFFFLATPAATVYFVLMLTSVRVTELTADWPTMEVGALKEQAAARRPSIFVVVRGDRGRQYFSGGKIVGRQE